MWHEPGCENILPLFICPPVVCTVGARKGGNRRRRRRSVNPKIRTEGAQGAEASVRGRIHGNGGSRPGPAQRGIRLWRVLSLPSDLGLRPDFHFGWKIFIPSSSRCFPLSAPVACPSVSVVVDRFVKGNIIARSKSGPWCWCWCCRRDRFGGKSVERLLGWKVMRHGSASRQPGPGVAAVWRQGSRWSGGREGKCNRKNIPKIDGKAHRGHVC